MMGLIGVVTGLVGILLHQTIYVIGQVKWHKAESYFQENVLKAWAWVVGYSVLFAIVSAASVSFFCLEAAGSGIPEVIGFLNGTVMRHVFNLRTFVVKFISCCLGVGAGLPAGPEGPMIHIGSIIGSGLSQLRCQSLNIALPFFTRFRNPEDRRNFTTAGVAAGVAAAFGAPVGGLLFAMEEVSSFWSMKLGWMIFFACMLATFTVDLFNSSTTAFEVHGNFGLFKTDKYVIFKVGNAIPVNVIMFAPALLLGIVGGVSGAMFTVLNLKISRLRWRLLSTIKTPLAQQFVRCLEPTIIMMLWATITVFLPAAFPCKPVVCSSSAGADSSLSNSVTEAAASVLRQSQSRNHSSQYCPTSSTEPYTIDDHVQAYWCEQPRWKDGAVVSGEYNEAASLLNVHGLWGLRLLFSRRTHLQFSYAALLSILPIYFTLSCWASGSALASGIVVPNLFIGGLYGRALGRLLTDLHGGVPQDIFWQWIDPGALALIGAASFFGGVSRLTMSLTVIMIEITNDVAFLLPIMVAVMVAKWVGDYITHPLYHSLLELKCIPFLDMEVIVYDESKQLLNLECFKARDVMRSPALTITPREAVSHLAHLLLETTHGGFPVVKYHNETRRELAYGHIGRTELAVILLDDAVKKQTQRGVTITPQIPYEEISVERIRKKEGLMDVLEAYIQQPHYKEIFINLEEFSLHRTYMIFRSLGLRHLTVVDMANRIVGIISRKDLMGFNLEEKLEQRKRRGYSVQGGIQKLLPSETNETHIV
ncbi:hypothetical protein NP493_51g02024 [Ridgeia piscesae]|uniref:Chloride channel protein n=1 Tax=Ridgeia piscesae TaxID=27915 RepID=A0AAD9PB73_RIDPI|nr:hypothetical protein NP493_51g02024 [Ridgeia piscesae]